MKENLYFSIFVTLFSVAIFLVIPYQISDMQISYISSRAFPILLSIVLFIVSSITLVHEIVSRKEKQNEKFVLISKQTLLIYLIMLGSVIGISFLGFNISVIIGSILILLCLKVKKWYAYALIPLITYAISIIFTTFLYIDLP